MFVPFNLYISGGILKIPTLHGLIDYDVEPFFKDRVIGLNNKGFPSVNSTKYGNHVVFIEIEMPDRISKESAEKVLSEIPLNKETYGGYFEEQKRFSEKEK